VEVLKGVGEVAKLVVAVAQQVVVAVAPIGKMKGALHEGVRKDVGLVAVAAIEIEDEIEGEERGVEV